jgi:DtxR family manganese transport transcriptional regulator
LEGADGVAKQPGRSNAVVDANVNAPVIDLRDADRRAALFQRIRKDHSVEIAEDYVELISDLIEINGEARLVDLASHLGVSRPTVNATIQRLQNDGFVDSKPYRSIFLTEKGRELADWSRARHKIVLEFLHAIGVPPQTAEADAEGMEHHVSDATLQALVQVTLRLREE